MSDFLFTNQPTRAGGLAQVIQGIYLSDAPEVIEYQGSWGSLAISKGHYRGFDPIETEQHIFTVIGGPALYFRDNSFLTGNSVAEATNAIYQRWLAGAIDWGNDFSGPFAMLMVDKHTGEVRCITDLMAFIPVYEAAVDGNLILGTHVDTVSSVAGKAESWDKVSVADFILNDAVTYPHTVYEGVRQIAPGTVTIYSRTGERRECSYWLPEEKEDFLSLNAAADHLRAGLQEYVSRITETMDEVAQFISGGEDSRALSGLLPSRLKRHSYIFLDQMNREGKVAAKVAKTYSVSFNPEYRSATHYLDILPEASRLVGTGHQYVHAHSLGFHKKCGLQNYQAVFGGYLSDSLLKACYTLKIRGAGRLPFMPEVGLAGERRTQSMKHGMFSTELLEQVTERRREHYLTVAQFRPATAHEWFVLWPATMRVTVPNFFSTRRLFRSYEPFMSHSAVKVAAATPTSWKLNRRLFQRTAKPWLKPSKWLFHVDGRLPYFPFWVNSPVQFCTWFFRQVDKRIGTGLVKGNQGPWADWLAMMNTRVWRESEVRYIQNGLASVGEAFSDFAQFDDQKRERFMPTQCTNMMQIGYSLAVGSCTKLDASAENLVNRKTEIRGMKSSEIIDPKMQQEG